MLDDGVVAVAITGASGAGYGVRLVECLIGAGRRVELLISPAGWLVLHQECGWSRPGDAAGQLSQVAERFGSGLVRYHRHDDWNSPLASGSGAGRPLVVVPCSMGSLAAVAAGISDNLIERAADVALKERWPLLLVVRETPVSAIHLENMLRLNRMGAIILPAAPGFYHNPTTIQEVVDFVVARILDQLGIPQRLIAPWRGEGESEGRG